MIRTMLCSALLVAAISPAAAQESGATGRHAPILESIPEVAKEPAPKVGEFLAGQVPGQLLSSDLIGLKVYGTSSQAVGTIDDILFDENGKLSVIVLDVGTYLGTEKRVAFALENLRYAAGKDDIRLVASVDRSMLEAAPEFRSLADEMELDDAQSLTTEESEPAEVEHPIPAH